MRKALFLKAHIQGYTKKDGTYVAPHEDKRSAAKEPEPATKPHITETPAFNRWFGDSKVVDGEGKPLVVYKGMWPYDTRTETETSSGFQIESIDRPSLFPAFNQGEEGVKIAGFFGDAKTANRFASAMKGAVYPVYLSIQNPFIIDANSRKAGKIQFGEEGREFRDAIRSGDYDGVIIKNTSDEGTIYVALRPGQIKSATGNRGTFDANDPNITKSHPINQATALGAPAPDLNDGDIRRNPGEPSQEQAKSSRYKKPTIRWNGLTIRIENPAGSVRRGQSRTGDTWEIRMVYDYGYVARSEGEDGDEVDVYVGPDLDAPMVYVIHQRKYGDWKAYDEDKCMIGFNSEEEAKAAYLQHYTDPRFLGRVTAMPVDEFKEKVRATKNRPTMIKGMPVFFMKSESAPKTGDKIEFLNDRHTDKGPSAGEVTGTKITADGLYVKIKHSDEERLFSWEDLRDGAVKQGNAWMIKAHVGSYYRNGKLVSGYDRKGGSKTTDAPGQADMFSAAAKLLDQAVERREKAGPEKRILLPKVDASSKTSNNNSESNQKGGAMKTVDINSIKRTSYNPTRAPQATLADMDKKGVDVVRYTLLNGDNYVITRKGVESLINKKPDDSQRFKVMGEVPDDILYEMDAHGVDEITTLEGFGDRKVYRRSNGSYLVSLEALKPHKSKAQTEEEKRVAASMKMFSREGN